MTALAIVAGILAASLVGTYLLVRRPHANALRDQFIAANEAQAGLYAHLTDYVLCDPDLADGFARLDAAIREAQKGERP